MEMQPLDSSHIEAVGHNPDTQVMHVKFRDGSRYEYDNVPESAYQALIGAESHGKHFRAEFRVGIYPSRRIF